MVTIRVLLVFVAFRFKFKVLCTYSVFILLSRKKFPWSPNGLLIRTTRKETPSCVTPVHLSHTDTHARRHTEPHARLLPSGRGAGARGHRSHTGRRSGAELRPWAPRVLWGQLERRGQLWIGNGGLPQTGNRISHLPRNVAASPELQNFTFTFDVWFLM